MADDVSGPPLTNPASADVMRLQAEMTALRQQVSDLSETLDEVEGAIVVYDRDRRFLLANQAYHALFPHLPADDVLRHERYEELLRRSMVAGTVHDPQAQSDPDGFVARRIAAMEQRQRLPRETTAQRPGRVVYQPRLGRWYLVRSRRTPSGNDVSLRVDITAQKQLQQALEEARAAAETSDRMKSQFLASVSHELRTPLNAVINFARLIAEEIHGPLGATEYRGYAQDIRDSGTHLLGLIDELLDLARAQAGRLTIQEGLLDPSALVRTVCRVLGPEAVGAGVSLSWEAPAERWSVRGDPVRLRQVLLNLVGNAIKFTASGGTVRVSLAVTDDGALRITVRDNGVGIAAEDLGRVMRPFEQVHAGRAPGIGLGLPLSRFLVELHGGQLALASTPGEGTTAEVALPADRVLGAQ
ncbi:MAG: ATP-binding protein [Acetobacteraceae bacterium]|nr:ATP-binding protein [Acetobacteraceae bacterium]